MSTRLRWFLLVVLTTVSVAACAPELNGQVAVVEGEAWRLEAELLARLQPEQWGWQTYFEELEARGVRVRADNLYVLAQRFAVTRGVQFNPQTFIDRVPSELANEGNLQPATSRHGDNCGAVPELFHGACVEFERCAKHGWEPDCGKTAFDCYSELFETMSGRCRESYLDVEVARYRCLVMSAVYREAAKHLGRCLIHLGPRLGMCGPMKRCAYNTLACGREPQYPDEYCGTMYCGDGVCQASHETVDSCRRDCLRCGDAVCASVGNYEGCSTCAADCGACASGGRCGDGTCERAAGEDCGTCAIDCGCNDSSRSICLNRQCLAKNCATGAYCGDGICCDVTGETHESCPRDCLPKAVCGNGDCEFPSEDCSSCPVDCGCVKDARCVRRECLANDSVCGDGRCDDNEGCVGCPEDCGACSEPCGDGICQPGVEDCGVCLRDCRCPEGATCVSGQCLAFCYTDFHCPVGTVCEESAGCTEPSLCVNGCHDDAQCPVGMLCRQRQCATCPCAGVCEAVRR